MARKKKKNPAEVKPVAVLDGEPIDLSEAHMFEAGREVVITLQPERWAISIFITVKGRSPSHLYIPLNYHP